MTRDLMIKRRPAASGETKSVVLFLHGYGADGADLLGLADPLAPHLRDTTFIAPDAPERSAANPEGHQWFPIPRLDGSSEAEEAAGIQAAAEDVEALIGQILRQEGLGPDRLVLFGFSQGAALAIKVAAERAEPVAGVVSFSGWVIDPEHFAQRVVSRPPVLLVHGDKDEMVPLGRFHEAGQTLEAAGFEVYGHVMEGTGHGISADGLSVALTFIAQVLGELPEAPPEG